MRVAKARLFRYTLPLSMPLAWRDQHITHRDGYILRLDTENGAMGLGEAAPLPGFSNESFHDAGASLERWVHRAAGAEAPLKPVELAGGVEAWNAEPPSVQFAVSTAAAMLKARAQGVPKTHLFARGQQSSIPLNALIMGSGGDAVAEAAAARDQGFEAVKVKVGRGDLSVDIQTVHDVQGVLGEDVSLRLDANRAWDYRTAEQFARGVRGIPIAYIEEPLDYWKLLFTFRLYTRMEYAVDETLALYRALMIQTEPAAETSRLDSDELWDEEQRQHLRHIVKRARAHIIKPTLFGGLRTMSEFIERSSRDWSAAPVISASFESGLGIILIANFVATLGGAIHPAGLDTHRWLARDILPGPLPIHRGRLDLTAANTMVDEIDFENLELVASSS